MDVPVVVLDNGAHTIKAGISTDPSEPRIIPNSITRSRLDKTTYIGHEFFKCQNYASLNYRLPFERGYLVDWDAQEAVWHGVFGEDVLGVDTKDCSLLITEPYFNLPNIQRTYDQFVFEYYDFQSCHRCSPVSHINRSALFSPMGEPFPECALIVDSGFSFTHTVPIMNGRIVWEAVRRVDIGGKLLTNRLKELASFRQWDVMEETYVMNQVKERCCFVSAQFKRDLGICKSQPVDNPIVLEYILPNFSTQKQGHIRMKDEVVTPEDQVLVMDNMRFIVPELLFTPSDIGMDQVGIAETVALSISLLPEELQGMFWTNIGLVGGNTLFPGFSQRLRTELRSLAPVEHEVELWGGPDSIVEPYRSLHKFASSTSFHRNAVTRAEYMEYGSDVCRRRFKSWNRHLPMLEPGTTAVTVGANDAVIPAMEGEGEEMMRGSPSPPLRGRGRGRGRGNGRGRGRRNDDD